MASYTENYGFKKPASTDKFAISDYNDNLDMIDTAISSGGGGYTPQETAAYSTAAPDVIFAMPVEQESEE